jgi:hypothetical protein
MCDDTSIKLHRCAKYIVVSSYIDSFINPNNPIHINNVHAPVSCRHFSPLNVEIKQHVIEMGSGVSQLVDITNRMFPLDEQ